MFKFLTGSDCMTFRLLPSVERLKETFDYDPDEGTLKRKLFRGKPCLPYLVGTPDNTGHLFASIDGEMFPITRIAWKIHYGEEPPTVIDHHPDVTPWNNRINNLRASDYSTNIAIAPSSVVSKSGIRGLSKVKNGNLDKWCAKLRGKGKVFRVYFPYTDEGKQEAIQWLDDMRKILHGE